MASKIPSGTVNLIPKLFRINRFFSQQCFLSPTYRCDEAWNQRLMHPPVQSIKPVEFYYDIDKKYRTVSKVFALDTDLFINKLTKENINNFLDEIEEITRRLRESPDTIRTLPSTTYAAIRLLLDIDHREMILKMITAPEKYGIFPNNHTWNMMLDHFLAKEDFTACARISAAMMLQENFVSPLTHSLAMLSCLQWVNAESSGEWVDYHPPEPEPEEEVKVRVSYISRPYHDEHFDLKDPNQIVGKTLLSGSYLFKGTLQINSKLLGLALYQKWDKLDTGLKRAIDSSVAVSKFVVDKVQSLIENVDATEKDSILASLCKLADSSLVNNDDLIVMVQDQVKVLVKEQESKDIDSQVKEYKIWNTLREEEIQRTLKEFEKVKLIEEIKKKKIDLEKEEERIFFFENEDKLKLMVADKKKFMEEEENTPQHPMYQWKKKKIRKDLGEEYIPPEVIKRRKE